MTNEQLVLEIIEHNNTELFGILYDRFSKVIYNKCYSFVSNEDEAKDLTQDVFLKLFVKLPSFKGKSKFSTWVYSFTYNHCVNYVSRNPIKKYETRFSDSYDIENYSKEGLFVNEDQADYKIDEKLKFAFNAISEDDKSILLLKYQKSLPIKSIEDILGLGTSAVKMRIKRARERFAVSYELAS